MGRRYKQRIVLFIDFLAFKEHVERTVNDPKFLRQLTRAVKMLRDVGMEREVFGSQRLTHFSDSVVLSYKVSERSAVFWLLSQIQLAVISLAEAGFLVRGAVTAGPLLHSKKFLVGPAMLKAYHLESKIARMPRVVVDPELMKIARKHRNDMHDPDEEERYTRAGLVEEDGLLWLDYISFEGVVEVAGCDQDGYPQYLAKIGQQVRSGLKHNEPGVLEKYLWLRSRYLAVIRQFRSVPPHADGDLEAQRSLVARLPAMKKRARRARRIVKKANAVTPVRTA